MGKTKLKLIEIARDLLTQEYYEKKDSLVRDWEVKLSKNTLCVDKFPELPSFPSTDDIILKARQLNNFVTA